MRRRLTTATLLASAATLAPVALPALGRPRPAVSIRDSFFAPGHLTVRAGSVVAWRWTGLLPHNVTVVSGPARFHSRTRTRGSFSARLATPGAYRLICTIHGFSMSLRVTGRGKAPPPRAKDQPAPPVTPPAPPPPPPPYQPPPPRPPYY